MPIEDTGEWLRAVVRGYFNYHAVPGNFPRLRSFRRDVTRSWWQSVRRRGNVPFVVKRLTGSSLSFSPLPRFCTLTHGSGFAPNIRDKNRVR